MIRIGLACGGGGDIGAAYMAGCISALHEVTGWDPGKADFIVGTSAGSIIGSALREGIRPEDFHRTMIGAQVSPDSAKKLTTQVLGGKDDALPPLAEDALTNARLNGPSLITETLKRPLDVNPVALAAAALPEGRLNHHFVREKILHLTGDKWPTAPLLVTATQMSNGRRVVLAKDSRIQTDLATAVAASCSIPSVFNPVTIDGHKYVDGGLRSSTNADVLARHELDLVIIMAPLSTGSQVTPSLAGPMRRACRIAAVAEQDALKAEGTKALTFHPSRKTIQAMGLNIMDVTKRARVSSYGREAALELLNGPKGEAAATALANA
ncbi:MAG: patatin-like phospholipase family protein [Actinomycetia bacterium]|nr:patatin-like phospholipase family protein [Actinomycetes bacterium]